MQIARKLQAKGYVIDLGLVEAGGLLHDLGRGKTHTVDHGVVGAQIAQTIGLPQAVINIIKRHVGAGITHEEAQWLGWPKDNYIPQTLEEKVVCYADKRIDHDQDNSDSKWKLNGCKDAVSVKRQKELEGCMTK